MITGSRQTLSTAPRPQFKTSQQMLLQRDHRSSSSSLLSLSGIRTPKAPRRASKIGSGTVTIRSAVEMITCRFFMTLNSTEKRLVGSKLRFKIRCQRLNAVSREYEEVEVEVPSPIYETIKLYNHQEMQQGGADLFFGPILF